MSNFVKFEIVCFEAYTPIDPIFDEVVGYTYDHVGYDENGGVWCITDPDNPHEVGNKSYREMEVVYQTTSYHDLLEKDHILMWSEMKSSDFIGFFVWTDTVRTEQNGYETVPVLLGVLPDGHVQRILKISDDFQDVEACKGFLDTDTRWCKLKDFTNPPCCTDIRQAYGILLGHGGQVPTMGKGASAP